MVSYPWTCSGVLKRSQRRSARIARTEISNDRAHNEDCLQAEDQPISVERTDAGLLGKKSITAPLTRSQLASSQTPSAPFHVDV